MDILGDKYRVNIGLEIHVQLLTKSKIFAADPNAYGDDPNTNISAITLGHPGTMPKLNKEVVIMAIKMGLASECDISRYNIFDRKNYFYPDLPKGYQLTQDRTPICKGGYVRIHYHDGIEKRILLNKIHLEEDAGKLIHDPITNESKVDYNRAGVPLIEIVTEPVITSPEDAGAVVAEVRKLVRYLGIGDGNMEEGSLRCDANISIRPHGQEKLGTKVEIKNMNSIKRVQKAINHEVQRQFNLIEKGDEVISETRMYDNELDKTIGMRTKEELNDYRYFPEPDLAPLIVSEKWISEIRRTLPSLPHELFWRLKEEFQLPDYDAGVLTEDQELVHFFLETCNCTTHSKAVSNWLMGPIKSYLNDSGKSIREMELAPEKLADLIAFIEDGKVSFSVASANILPNLLKKPNTSVVAIAEKLNLIQESNLDVIQSLIDEVIAENPQKVKEYHKGKKGIVQMFMGQVMKKSRGKADPKKANELIRKSLTLIKESN